MPSHNYIYRPTRETWPAGSVNARIPPIQETDAQGNRKKLWRSWAFWRGVCFVSSRTGRIAAKLDQLWWKRFGPRGSVPPSMQMPLAEAMALLGVPADYGKDDVIRCFRRAAMKAHPDQGGTAEMFRELVEAHQPARLNHRHVTFASAE
jgi:hypothetical protein